uniref:Uncharacterized protein n=1 Tax=Arundo donax TaxID=35708 RepID=A0A0A9ESE0_ARUDO
MFLQPPSSVVYSPCICYFLDAPDLGNGLIILGNPAGLG